MKSLRSKLINSFMNGAGVITVGFAALPGSIAYAQSGEMPNATNAQPADSGLIVVTAERRETNLQDTPQSITVLSGEKLARTAVNDFEELTSEIQGLNFDAVFSDSPRLGMRGIITREDSAGTDQSVGLFIDGVYFGKTSLLSQSFSDVERVEVLRGPQGTLFGRNVVGGALSLVTKDPTNELEASASATIGNNDRLDFQGRVAGPIAGNLLGQISASYESTDGYVTNLVTGNDLLGQENIGVRGKLKLDSPSGINFELSGGYQNNKTDGRAQALIFQSQAPDYFTIPADFDYEKETIQKFDGQGESEMFYGILDVSAEVSDAITLYSLTSYIDFEGNFLDGVFVPIPAVAGSLDRDYYSDDKSFSQEFRASYEQPGFFVQGGVYYYYNKAQRIEEWTIGGAPGSAAEAFLAPAGTTFTITDQTVKTNSYAAFAQANVDITDWFTLIAGIRYTDETKDTFTSNQGDFPSGFLAGPPYMVSASDSWSAWTPRVTGQFNLGSFGPVDDFMFFGTYSEGWKSGGYNPGLTAEEAVISFRPEEAENYEVGFKSTWLGGDMTLNATYFHVKYSDLQVIVTEVDAIRTENASATVDGFEFEMVMRPTANLSFNLGYAYTDGTFDDGSIVDGAPVGGNRVPITAEHSISVAANLDIPVGDYDLISTNISYNYSSDYFGQPANDTFLGSPQSQNLTEQSNLSASISYETGPWRFTAFGRNLLDDFWVAGANTFPTFWNYSVDSFFGGANALSASYGPPRTYGFTVAWEY